MSTTHHSHTAPTPSLAPTSTWRQKEYRDGYKQYVPYSAADSPVAALELERVAGEWYVTLYGSFGQVVTFDSYADESDAILRVNELFIDGFGLARQHFEGDNTTL